MSWNRTVTCSHCYNEGHNRRSCPKLREYVKENPESWTATRYHERKAEAQARRCGYCKEVGHNRRSCKALCVDKRNIVLVNADWCHKVKNWMEAAGIGIGALVTVKTSGRDDTPKIGMVADFQWDSANFKASLDEWIGQFVKVVTVGSSGSDWYRLSDECPGFDATGFRNVLTIASPIASLAVRAQIPVEWASGQMGIDEMFTDVDRRYGPSQCIANYAAQNDVEIEKD